MEAAPRRSQFIRYPTRAYQTDQPSLNDDPVSDHKLEDVINLVASTGRSVKKEVMDGCFLLTVLIISVPYFRTPVTENKKLSNVF